MTMLERFKLGSIQLNFEGSDWIECLFRVKKNWMLGLFNHMTLHRVAARHQPICWTSPPSPPLSPPRPLSSQHLKKMPDDPWSNDRHRWMSRSQLVNVSLRRRRRSYLHFSSELILRDSTNAGCKSEGSPVHSAQKRQQKKKKRRTANSYSDVSFNDKYKLTEELLGTGAHG